MSLSTRIDVVLEDHSSFVSEHTSDISEGGMFIETADPWPEGTVFGFGLRPHRGIPPLRGRAEVIWVRYVAMGPDKPVGMGARFVDLDAEGLETIRSLISFEVDETATGTAEVFDVDEGASGGPTAAVEHADVFPKPGETGVGFFGEQQALAESSRNHASRRRSRRWLVVVFLLLVGVAAAVLFVTWYGGFHGLRRAVDGHETGDHELHSAVATSPGMNGASVSNVPTVSRILGIAWIVKEKETVVTISGDGGFSADRVHTSLLQDPPRFVLRLTGIVEGYRPSTIPVVAPGMGGIRVGHHTNGAVPQLHVVLDLASEDVVVAPLEVLGDTLAIRVQPAS